jgi:hypothetical protein
VVARPKKILDPIDTPSKEIIAISKGDIQGFIWGRTKALLGLVQMILQRHKLIPGVAEGGATAVGLGDGQGAGGDVGMGVGGGRGQAGLGGAGPGVDIGC